MKNVIFYILLISIAGGVLLRSFLFIEVEIYGLLLLMAFGLGVLWWRSGLRMPVCDVHTATIKTSLGIAALVISMTALGGWRFSVAEERLLATKNLETGSIVTVTGRIIREPENREQATLVTFESGSTRILMTTDRHSAVVYGDVIEVRGVVTVPEPFTTDTGRTFDYPHYLAAKGVVYTMLYPDVKIRELASTYDVLWYLYEIKHYVLAQLSRILPEPQMGLAAGLLLGVQSALGEELEADFRTVGITHIIVLSGYNMLLVATFFMLVLSYVLPWRLRLGVTALMVIAFALLVGYQPSVIRATLMVLLVLATKLWARPYIAVRALLLAATAMILINPYILRYDIGFQLSCMATLGLITLTPWCESWLRRVPEKFGLRTMLAATISTQLAVAPILLYAMGSWSLVAIPVNLLVLPMVAVAMFMTFGTAVIALISHTLAYIPGIAAYVCLSYIITVATTVARLPGASIAIPPFSPWLAVAMYGVVAFFWYRSYQSTVDPSLPQDQKQALSMIEATWTIVEEDELSAVKQKAADVTSVTSAASTPVFFR